MAKEQIGTEVDATHMNTNANTLMAETVETPTPTRKNKKEEEEETLAEDTQRQQSQIQSQSQSQSQEQPKGDMLPLQTNGEIKQPKQIRTPRATSSPPSPPSSQVLIIPGQQAATLATNAARKIRRAFSMPRNPFRWSRKFKTTPSTSATNNGSAGESQGGGTRGANAAIISCVGGGRGRSGSIVSLNSYEMLVCKDSNGNVQSPTEDAKNKRNTIATPVSTSAATMRNGGGSGGGGGNEKKAAGGHNHARVLRRSSFRKFLHRIAQHLSSSVNTVGPHNKNATPAAAAAATTGTAAIATAATTTTTTNGTTTAMTTTTTAATTTTTSERVPPIGGYQWPADQTPGVMGLKNHGNTCFMNAVLQCLSHTDILAEYFVLDQYKADLKRRNKINARKFGTKGELTEQLANVLKALWTCKNESDHSTGFKAVVDRYGAQFRSSTQHDAQEFLFWLLDKVHEDLNTATKRRYKSVKNNYGRPDEIIAAETLANHIRCNNSFVQAVFQAQFRSSLTCPRCQKQSNTFDPFHCISVQLPQLTQQTIFVTVVNVKHKPRQVKIGLTVPAGSPIVALREQLQADTGIAAGCMVLVDLNQEGFTRVFYDTQPVETLKDIETIYCIEVPPAIDPPSSGDSSSAASANEPTMPESKTIAKNDASKPNDVDSNAKSVTAPAVATHATDLLLLVANVHKKKKELPVADTETESGDTKAAEDAKQEEFVYERFGAPFSMKAPRDCSYMELQKRMLREMSALLKPEVFSYATPLTDMFQIRLQDPSADPDTYLENVEHPLLTEMIDMALSVLSTEAGPPHIKLLLEWRTPEAHFVELNSNDDTVVEHESVARLNAKKSNDTASLTLEQCLEHYTKAETLSAEDAWRCPHCQQYLPVVKTLGLWSLPDILVVHFKRFRQHHEKGPQAAKLTTMVKFPLNAFDMSPHLARGINGEINAPSLDVAAASTNFRPSPWKKTNKSDSRSSTLSSRAEQKDTRYDLYAVCYHQGDTLETGHYTAACKNPYDRQWYKFDDQRVSKVPEDAIQEEIINNEAYMLFYQRRVVDAAECSGSSSNSGDHWVSRIAPAPSLIVNKEKSQEKIEVQKSSTQMKEEEEEKAPEKERAQSKPIEIPKVCSEIDEDTSLTTPADELVTQPSVTMSTADKRELLNIEELDFADADVNAEDNDVDGGVADDVNEIARQKEVDVIKLLDGDKDSLAQNSSDPDACTIFKMDEEVKPSELKAQQKLSSDDSTDAEPEIISTVAEVLTKPPAPMMTSMPTTDNANAPTTNGKILPYDIKSHSASNTSSANSSSSSLSSGLSPHTIALSVHQTSSPQAKLNGLALTNAGKYNDTHREIQLSSSLKSHTGSMNGTPIEFQLSRHHLHNHHHHHPHNQPHNNPPNWQGSRSSVSAVENSTQQTQRHATSLKLRHSFSTSSNYKLRECSETLSSLLRNSANTCSKDTLLFIDQQSHHHGSLIEDDSDSYMGRSLWISPVTPHKLITVSPKN